MREKFSWLLRPSDAEFKSLWQSSLFVFDANVLLDLYRFTRTTTNDLLKTLEHVKDRIWLPHQAASEFFKRREDVIDTEAAAFRKAIKALEKWASDERDCAYLKGMLANTGRVLNQDIASLYDEVAPFRSAVDEMEKLFKSKIEELEHRHAPTDPEKDYILERVLGLFDGKVGTPFAKLDLDKLHLEAEERYKLKTPPGFMDVDKPEPERYNDFVIWRQILDRAVSTKCSVIFVTSEKKEDWWYKKGNEIKYPLPALRREFKETTNQEIWLYRPENFLKQAEEMLKVTINLSSIQETTAVSSVVVVDPDSNPTDYTWTTLELPRTVRESDHDVVIWLPKTSALGVKPVPHHLRALTSEVDILNQRGETEIADKVKQILRAYRTRNREAGRLIPILKNYINQVALLDVLSQDLSATRSQLANIPKESIDLNEHLGSEALKSNLIRYERYLILQGEELRLMNSIDVERKELKRLRGLLMESSDSEP